MKFELLIPVRSAERPTACMSFNCHRDHFSSTFGLATASGEAADTACVAFGMDRLALALFATHGLDTTRWPQQARESLGLRRPPCPGRIGRRCKRSMQRP
jgi:seryl-tRNA synthetase